MAAIRELLTEEQEKLCKAEAFDKLISYLDSRKDVQNIQLMETAGFCRNCLANWLQQAVEGHGIEITKEESREIIYGIPYDEWKKRYQI